MNTGTATDIITSMRRRRSNHEDHYAKPFFKWAGGKSQLLAEFHPRLPAGLGTGHLDRYIEPFIGGGAVFFFIMQLYPVKESFICDANEELVLTYRVVKEDVDSLIALLTRYQDEYDAYNQEERGAMYLRVRSELNAARPSFDFSSYSPAWVTRAAAHLFLNKTCFNGLFRVNSKGEFNVPFGKYANPGVVQENNLRTASAVLANTTILQGDFSVCQNYCNERSFVYLDPPYRPLNRTSSFTKYSQDGFTDQDQVRLRDFFAQADQGGARVMLSNSDPMNQDPDDRFFDDLYQAYRIERVQAKRVINRDADKRGAISEIIVMNYDPCLDSGLKS